MATATRAKPTEKAVVAQSLTPEQLRQLLQQSGMVSTQRPSINRASLDSGMLTVGDDTYVYNPSKPEIPAVVVRIFKPPSYYMSFYLDKSEENGAIDAGRIGRDELNGGFCKKYDDPADQALDNSPANEVYDEIVATVGRRGSFKADIQFQIVPDSGVMTGEETVWTLSLSTTSVFEWRGTSQNPDAGLVSETNFMYDLAALASQQAAEAGSDESTQMQAVLNALTSLRLGGVVAEVRLLKAQNKEKTNTWTVVNFRPIHIEAVDSLPELDDGTANSSEAADDVPI